MCIVAPSGNFCREAAIARASCPIGAAVPLGPTVREPCGLSRQPSEICTLPPCSHLQRARARERESALWWEVRAPSWAVSESMPHSDASRPRQAAVPYPCCWRSPRSSVHGPSERLRGEERGARGERGGAMESGGRIQTLWQHASRKWREHTFTHRRISTVMSCPLSSTAKFRPARRVAGVW